MEYFYEDETEEYSCLGVQAFSCDEWVFMCGASLLRLGVRAIPISVYSYEINMMGVAESLDHDTKPFLTYLREDDTYQTLTDRIQLYTGENNWEKLALVSRMFRAYLLPIESPSQSDDGDGNPNMEFEEDDEKTDSWFDREKIFG